MAEVKMIYLKSGDKAVGLEKKAVFPETMTYSDSGNNHKVSPSKHFDII